MFYFIDSITFLFYILDGTFQNIREWRKQNKKVQEAIVLANKMSPMRDQ